MTTPLSRQVARVARQIHRLLGHLHRLRKCRRASDDARLIGRAAWTDLSGWRRKGRTVKRVHGCARNGAGEDARVLVDHFLRRDRGEEVELPVHDLPRLWIGLDLLSERQAGRTQPGELRRVFIGRCRERSPIAGVREQVARLVPPVADRRISRMSRLWPRRKLTTAPSGSW